MPPDTHTCTEPAAYDRQSAAVIENNFSFARAPRTQRQANAYKHTIGIQYEEGCTVLRSAYNNGWRVLAMAIH